MNRRRTRLGASAFLLASLAAAGRGQAADFTFRVPLELINTPFNLARVVCAVYGKVDGKNDLIGSAYRDIFDYQIVGGNYNQVVEIGFGAYPGKDPNWGETWLCELLVGLPGRPSFVQTNQIEGLMKPDGIYPRDPSKPFRVSTHGPVPTPSPKGGKRPPPSGIFPVQGR